MSLLRCLYRSRNYFSARTQSRLAGSFLYCIRTFTQQRHGLNGFRLDQFKSSIRTLCSSETQYSSRQFKRTVYKHGKLIIGVGILVLAGGFGRKYIPRAKDKKTQEQLDTKPPEPDHGTPPGRPGDHEPSKREASSGDAGQKPAEQKPDAERKEQKPDGQKPGEGQIPFAEQKSSEVEKRGEKQESVLEKERKSQQDKTFPNLSMLRVYSEDKNLEKSDSRKTVKSPVDQPNTDDGKPPTDEDEQMDQQLKNNTETDLHQPKVETPGENAENMPTAEGQDTVDASSSHQGNQDKLRDEEEEKESQGEQTEDELREADGAIHDGNSEVRHSERDNMDQGQGNQEKLKDVIESIYPPAAAAMSVSAENQSRKSPEEVRNMKEATEPDGSRQRENEPREGAISNRHTEEEEGKENQERQKEEVEFRETDEAARDRNSEAHERDYMDRKTEHQRDYPDQKTYAPKDDDRKTDDRRDRDQKTDDQRDRDRKTDAQRDGDRETHDQRDRDQEKHDRRDRDRKTDYRRDDDRKTDAQRDGDRETHERRDSEAQSDRDRKKHDRRDRDHDKHDQRDRDRKTDYRRDDDQEKHDRRDRDQKTRNYRDYDAHETYPYHGPDSDDEWQETEATSCRMPKHRKISRKRAKEVTWVFSESSLKDDRIATVLDKFLPMVKDLQLDGVRMLHRTVPGSECRSSADSIVIVPCISASRVGSDIEAAILGAKLNGSEQFLLVLFHHKSPHNSKVYPTRSKSVLDRALQKRCEDIIDVVYWMGNIYECPQNTQAMSEIKEQLENYAR